MAETTPTPPPSGGAPAGTQPTAPAPRLSIVTQYIKDLSFESPHPPSVDPGTDRPKIGIGVEVRAQKLSAERYEVIFQLRAEAKSEDQPVFMFELVYAGLFAIANVPEESMQPVLLIECPRLLFPFARRIVADVTRDGGFPPLMVDPIDFVTLYRQRHAQAQAQSAAEARATNPDPGGNGGVQV